MNYIYIKGQYLSVKDLPRVSFEVFQQLCGKGLSYKDSLKKTKPLFSKTNLVGIAQDIPKHSVRKYINKETLTQNYFKKCQETLNDLHIYLVISSTGSPASELLSVFTQKVYNHISLSFDKDLETVVSYNGGENISFPGLNQEQLEFFNKKEDASLLIYSLELSQEQKIKILENISEINKTGSAYNWIGLLSNMKLKPNIMYCSQFIYKILEKTDLLYFKAEEKIIKPTDFIEKDYYRKLKFCKEIKFNDYQKSYRL
ncbi:MAG: hypothetical protein ACK5LM_07500 [Lactovum sp.]